jgi:L-gulonate 3-dehydrogenase
MQFSGLIGRGWAMLFSGAGHSVALFDISQDLIDKAITDIEKQFLTLESSGLLRGSLTTAQRLALITGIQ